MNLSIKKLNACATLPTRGSAFAAGYDLYAAEDAVVKAWNKSLVSTCIAVAVPHGYYGRIAPRSGLAVKHNIGINAGVIDSDYRGHVKVLLINHGKDEHNVSAGDKIAQLILEKIATPEVLEVDDLEGTVRGNAGFGSTGV